MSTTEVVVGRVGRAHGVRGEVSVEPRTDEPERRFALGARLRAAGPRAAPERWLTVRGLRRHQGRLLVTFAELADRTSAEGAAGLLLHAVVDSADSPGDPEEYYDHQLVGLRVVTTDATPVGTVERVLHGPGQDLLVVRRDGGGEALVPFVAALVPVVDLAGGLVEVADRPGLLAPLEDDAGEP